MNFPTKQQHQFLAQLLAKGGSAPLKDLKGNPKPADRAALVSAGRIKEEKRPTRFSLTDAGRTWINEHPTYVPPPSAFPKPNHRLVLLQLAFLGGTAPANDLKPKLTSADQKVLSEAKLLQKDPGPKRSVIFTLTDAGWKWAEDHLADPANVAGVRGVAPGATLQHVLAKVGAFLAAGDLRLADLIRGGIERKPAPQATRSESPEGRIEHAIEAACLRLGGGRDRQRLRLADVRQDLVGWDRAAQDKALFDLATTGQLVLYGMSDPQEIQPDDRKAEFRTPSGEPRHLVYWIGGAPSPTR